MLNELDSSMYINGWIESNPLTYFIRDGLDESNEFCLNGSNC